MAAVNSLLSAFRGGLNPKPARAYIIPLDIHHGDEPILAERKSFQYFPQSISDQRATNYQAKVIPGLSHPLYQWTSSGARTISFQAVFSRDRSYTKAENDSIEAGVTSLSNLGGDARGSLAAQADFRNRNNGVNGSGSEPRNVDIPSAIAWLRSFLDPEYSSDGHSTYGTSPARPRPPRKMILGFPNVRINWGVPELKKDEVYSIMTQCDVSYEGFFANGAPRFARVDLSFAEIIQIGGGIRVHDALNKRRVAYAGYGLNDQSNKGT